MTEYYETTVMPLHQPPFIYKSNFIPCRIYKLDFQEKNVYQDHDLNHGSPDF